MNTSRRLQQLLGKGSDIYSEPGSTSYQPTQIRPSLEYCSHIWGAAAPTSLSILNTVQRRAIRPIGDPALTCHLQPLSHRRGVGDLSLFSRYTNGFYSSELTSIVPPLSKPARCTRGLLLLTLRWSFFIHQVPNDTTAPLSPGRIDCLVMYLLSRRMLAYSSLASTSFPQPNLPSSLSGRGTLYLGPAFAVCSVIKKTKFTALVRAEQRYLYG
nr:unnamed protein product [Callosobruchus chinensis]